MSTKLVLGPHVGNYFEPTPSTQGYATLDNLRVTAGGKVTVNLVPNDESNPTKRPKTLYAFYADPNTVPPLPARTGQWFMDSPAKRGSIDVSAVAGGDVTVDVPGVEPGSVSFVQVVMEFDEP